MHIGADVSLFFNDGHVELEDDDHGCCRCCRCHFPSQLQGRDEQPDGVFRDAERYADGHADDQDVMVHLADAFDLMSNADALPL